MLKKIIFSALLLGQSMMAQNTITSNLGDFNEIKVYRGITVNLIKSGEQKIVIEGEKSSDVVVKNINGVLKITMAIIQTFSAKDVSVTVYYKNLDILDSNEGSILTSKEIINQDKLTVKSQEGGQIDLTVKVKNLDAKCISGGVVKLKGSADSLNVIANSGGIFSGDNLLTERANISSSTGAQCTVNVSKYLDADAKIGAVITVLGKPVEILKTESLGGYIRN
ncbi:MAG: head GIN domain-containing protein [Flavobacteriaceae bacterium]|nr:head GIN domain-containing protein [Flavobacteriaceae bacterium]